jgi:hypothetical protein
MDSFLTVKLVKEEDRGEKKFRAFNKIILFAVSVIILFILSSKMLRALRLFKFLIFFKSKRHCLRSRRARVLYLVI